MQDNVGHKYTVTPVSDDSISVTRASRTLYIVATPIGNLDDMSIRAIRTLSECHRIYAEDTRHSRALLQHHGIDTPLYSLHEHNESARIASIIDFLQDTGSVALISDAGTPLISDPGYRIVRACQESGIAVSPIPGACALIAALSAAGLPTDRFLFAGFPPVKSGARQQWLQALGEESATLVFYESPHRIVGTLSDMQSVFGTGREVTVARELTKRFETISRSTVADALHRMQVDTNQQRGEFVLLVEGAMRRSADEQQFDEARRLLLLLLPHMALKNAAKVVAEHTGVPRKEIYAHGISLNKAGPA